MAEVSKSKSMNKYSEYENIQAIEQNALVSCFVVVVVVVVRENDHAQKLETWKHMRLAFEVNVFFS